MSIIWTWAADGRRLMDRCGRHDFPHCAFRSGLCHVSGALRDKGQHPTSESQVNVSPHFDARTASWDAVMEASTVRRSPVPEVAERTVVGAGR